MRSLRRERERGWFSRAWVDVMMGETSPTHWKSEDLGLDKNGDSAGSQGRLQRLLPTPLKLRDDKVPQTWDLTAKAPGSVLAPLRPPPLRAPLQRQEVLPEAQFPVSALSLSALSVLALPSHPSLPGTFPLGPCGTFTSPRCPAPAPERGSTWSTLVAKNRTQTLRGGIDGRGWGWGVG